MYISIFKQNKDVLIGGWMDGQTGRGQGDRDVYWIWLKDTKYECRSEENQLIDLCLFLLC